MIHYEVRAAEYADLEKCLDTIHAAFGQMEEKYGYTRETYPTSGAYLTLEDLRSAKDRGIHIYAAYVGERVVGCVQLEKTGDGIYAFRRFAVLPEYQNLGIGRVLIDHCRKKAISYGGRRLTLIMAYENVALRGFYESNGFCLIRSGNENGYPFLCAIMEMEL